MEQKKLFLGLAKQAALANKVLVKSEEQLLAAYADEMDIKLEDVNNLPFDALCKELKEISSHKELNQITFEIIAMLLSDNEFDTDEQVFLSKVISEFGISDETIEEMKRYVNDYMMLINKINGLMLK